MALTNKVGLAHPEIPTITTLYSSNDQRVEKPYNTLERSITFDFTPTPVETTLQKLLTQPTKPGLLNCLPTLRPFSNLPLSSLPVPNTPFVSSDPAPGLGTSIGESRPIPQNQSLSFVPPNYTPVCGRGAN
jgi:hypothetical protein